MSVLILTMKPTILLFISILIITFGCGKDCLPEEHNFNYTEGKGILISYDSIQQHNTYNTLEGPFLLFEYSHLEELCVPAIDRGWGEHLIFTIPDSLTDFNVVDSTILLTNCYYYDDSGVIYSQPVRNGVIEGNKLTDGDWSVKVDIYVRPDSPFSLVELKHVKFESLYTK